MTDSFTYIDPAQLYGESLDSWESLWEPSASLWDNFKSLFNSSILLPDHEIQSPIVLAASLANQKWSKTLPLVLLYGKEGSAKSQIIKLNAALHDATVFGADCTFASIRNELTRQKWLDPEERKQIRDGAILLLDNVYPDTFLVDSKLLSMFLRAYEEGNDTCTIASAMGENITFRTFCSKFLSSVQLFSSIHALRELNRRMITIRTKALRDMSAEELGAGPSGDILDLDSINWNGLNWAYVQFWNEPVNCARYVSLRKQLTRSNSATGKYMKSVLTEEKCKILVDLIVTSVVTGGFSTLESAIDAFAAFYQLHAQRMADTTPASIEAIQAFIDDELSGVAQHNQQAELIGVEQLPETIDAAKLKAHLKALEDAGGVEHRLGPKEINSLMVSLGWKLKGRPSVWVRAAK